MAKAQSFSQNEEAFIIIIILKITIFFSFLNFFPLPHCTFFLSSQKLSIFGCFSLYSSSSSSSSVSVFPMTIFFIATTVLSASSDEQAKLYFNFHLFSLPDLFAFFLLPLFLSSKTEINGGRSTKEKHKIIQIFYQQGNRLILDEQKDKKVSISE
ncbi:uncharacterized protein LOC120085456 isoform X1 [Benincasa hispida]|uniref:uncharacterized protein LOC120085456 isoform X1 n=1 Tax=Benincasa hispida TaxID=102211 RepID=UPI001901F1EC|nr:uncharacterized protein LOC120085456 isoform X1 [Benincasa hispida]